jgi:hypothetical protein
MNGVLTSYEQRVSCKDGFVVAIFEQETHAILRVARRVQGFHFDAANVESFVVSWSLGDFLAVSSANDGEWIGFQLLRVWSVGDMAWVDMELEAYNLGVAAGMVVVADWRSVSQMFGVVATSTYWWVLMMLVNFLPDSVAFFRLGRTLNDSISELRLLFNCLSFMRLAHTPMDWPGQ